jgi:flagellar M-ring protein FliF
MDFLNQAYAQLADLFRSMTPAARITAGLLLAVVVISLVYLVGFRTSGSDEYLLGGQAFSERELARMEGAFSKAKLARWERRDNRMRVPRGQKAAYMAALWEGDALPADFNSYFSKLSENESPFVNRQQREMNFKVAKQRELAHILENLQGVEAATVQYDEVDKGGFPRRTERTAIVAVRPKGGGELSQEQVRSIRNFMAAAIAGLQRSNVTVMDLNTGMAHAETNIDGAPGGGDNLFLESQAACEKFFKDKICDKLAMIPGVVVGVNVSLDPKTHSQTTETTYQGQPHSVESTSFNKETPSSQLTTGGRVGAVPNGVGNTGASVSNAASTTSESLATENREEQKNILDQMTTTRREAPFVPQHVTASISVPSSYYAKVWREQNPAAEGQKPPAPDPAALQKIEIEVKQRIEEDIIQLLPQPAKGESPYPLVKVTTYQDLTPPPTEAPGVATTAFTWLGGSWRTLAMTLVALASLLMLRGMIRADRATRADTASATPSAANERTDLQPPTEPILKRPSRPSSATMREELIALVNEDPDAAANVLRNWISEAA